MASSVCGVCFKTFASKKSLKRHSAVCQARVQPEGNFVDASGSVEDASLADVTKRRQEMDKAHVCEVCKRRFSRKYHLSRHRTQTLCGGQTPPTYPCEVCGKRFSRNDNLREHLRIHTGESIRRRKHACSFCAKRFTSLTSLTIHVRMHTGEKPFRCETCTMAFTSEGALKNHRRVHTGERPYACEECGARFSLSGTLNRHRITHAGLRPRKCRQCGEEFFGIRDWKAHMFQKHGATDRRKAAARCKKAKKAKPYKCKSCRKTFLVRKRCPEKSDSHAKCKDQSEDETLEEEIRMLCVPEVETPPSPEQILPDL